MKMRVRNKAAWADTVTLLEEENKQVAYEAALEGIVLLENDGCLPVKPGKVALFGAGADMTIKGGTGSGEVNGRHAVSILEGLEMAGFEVTTKGWLQAYRRFYELEEEKFGKDFRKSLIQLNLSDVMEVMSKQFQYPFDLVVDDVNIGISDTDTCIYVIARQAGEGADRRIEKYEYGLSPRERANIEKCAEVYEKMILVINVGSSFDMSFLDEITGINAVVFFAQQGAMGGKAFADLICGNATPSGKLADTWAKKYEDIPYANEYSYLNGDVYEEYYKEGIYVGYRYFDSYQVEPKYPFGYGLSYTTFAWQLKEVTAKKNQIMVKVNVTNTGDTYAGKEIIQLYVSCPQGNLPKEYQKLAAFAKTDVLAPGASQELKLTFYLNDQASYRAEDGTMVLEAGDYLLRVGNSSRNTKVCAKVKLKEEVITKKLTHICAREEVLEEIAPAQIQIEEIEEDVPVIEVNAEDFTTQEYVYETPDIYSSKEVDALLDNLTVKEMAALTVGAGMGSGTYFHAPGAVGITNGKLLGKGIPNICMADGPAGLRLQRQSVVLRNGKVKGTEATISFMKYMPEIANKVTLGDPEKHPSIYQFTTAFPVELALAQTWNPDLLEKVGSAVGEEMKAYGITYWLAPALNIHRNPLCGRNFEYFSEDPYLSGIYAAAITKGVQKHRGCYVTMKHFCCNNQEDNRKKTNANVNDRALREIYLRGFEIAVREGRPGAMMTSYNKVNGTYVNNSYDLVTKVLKNEWGFDGLVMTDWYATGKSFASNALCIEAGGDIIMPGSASAVSDIYQAVKMGTLREEDVKRSAANVLKGIVSSRIYQAYKKSRKNL